MTRPLVARSSATPGMHLRPPLPDWQRRAACGHGADPDIFNGPGLDLEAAREFCAVCPVRAECLDAGRAEHAEGVYGGRLLSWRQRSPVLLALGSTDDATLRKLHSLYVQGRRDELVVAGQREYTTRSRRARRAEAAS